MNAALVSEAGAAIGVVADAVLVGIGGLGRIIREGVFAVRDAVTVRVRDWQLVGATGRGEDGEQECQAGIHRGPLARWWNEARALTGLRQGIYGNRNSHG